MYCTKCGKEIASGETMCDECRAKFGAEAASPEALPAQDNKRKGINKNLLIGLIAGGVVTVIAVIVILVLVTKSDPVERVRGGRFNSYPNMTVGEGFERSFDNPEWSSYKSNGNTYVVFTGNIDFLGEYSDARVVFQLDGDNFAISEMQIGQWDIMLLMDNNIEPVLSAFFK